MTGIEFKNISYIYSPDTPFEKKALDNINVVFKGGIITGLIGHTGSGKSTLVQLMNGLLKPTTGNVYLDGEDIWLKPKNMRQVRFRVGLVFQYPEYQLFEETVYKDIAFGPINMGLEQKEIEVRVREAARFCGIDDSLFPKSPFELSGGQRRRVAIAGVIAMQPDVLVLDEPAAGLDPMGREDILGGIRSYQRHRRNTVIIVSHSMEDMARYSDEIIVMRNGGIFVQGSCADVFRDGDRLKSVGLNIPQITGVMIALKNKGADVNTDIFTVDAAREEILRHIKNKAKDCGGQC